MTFNSLAFLLLLPVVALAAAALVPRPRARTHFLLAFSLFFYGYWDWRFLALLAGSIVVDYAVGLRLGSPASARARRAWMGLSLVFNLGLLGAFKYYGFFAESLAAMLASVGLHPHLPVLRMVLPVGISFYTFQSLAYTLDVYRGRIPAERDLADYALYVCFFPQLVAGPIERAGSLMPQLKAPRRPGLPQVREGAYLVLYGLFQKVAVADAAAPLVDYLYLHIPGCGWPLLLAGAAAFSLQIYGDFAGYSNIARGSAKLLGVELMVNFAHPYAATSITGFWRRWHVSLSTWLRDYLYIPLGGNRLGFRRGLANLMLVMLLGGLWHGARWTFVAWGGLHGLYLVWHRLMARGRPPVAGADPGPTRALKIAGVFTLVSLTWVFFRSPDLGTALGYLGALASLQAGEWRSLSLQIGIVAAFLAPFEWMALRTGDEAWPLGRPWHVRGPLYAFLIWSVLGGIGAQRAFIYFQF